jgi:hypothetical protein
VIWTDRRSLTITRPRPDIAITVMRWSRHWTWTIRKIGTSSFIARGIADTIDEGKQAAEEVWDAMTATDQDMMVQINAPFERRSR